MKKILIWLAVIFTVLCFAGCKCERNQSVVSVSGVGTVMALPDSVQMQISIYRIARTTRQAQEEVSVRVKQALAILENAGIESRNINTASLRFSPEYDWSGSRRISIGQKAEQGISFSIGINAGEDGTEPVSNIIDQLIQIDGITLQQMNFSVKNTDELFVRSRELAYQKALEKAEQYANLSGMRITGTLSITEEGASHVYPVNRALNNRAMALSREMDYAGGSTALPTGELEITSRIVIDFLMK